MQDAKTSKSMGEVWKDIKGYEGLYMISDRGRVKSLSHVVKRGCCTCATKEKILTAKRKKSNKGDYYLFTNLSKDGVSKNYHLHRLVAAAFVPNTNNYPTVDHIDGNKDNNCASNLRWCTMSQNIRNKNTFYKWKSLVQVECWKNGEFVGMFRTMTEASKATNIPITTISGIVNHKYGCNGRKTGYSFRKIEKKE